MEFNNSNLTDGIYEIPMLHDHHSHPLLYASCRSGVDVSAADTREEALRMIAQRSDELSGKIVVAMGWLDSKFQLTAADLDAVGPAAVFNLSLHGLVMNRSARGLLEERLDRSIENWSDQDWYERHFREILNSFALLNADVDQLQGFYDWLYRQHGVIFAEEMLLVDPQEITLFHEAGLQDKTRFWCSPEMYRDLPSAMRDQVYGLKLFTDGALGVSTAALHKPYRQGGHGILMYNDQKLTALLQECCSYEKALAIHAIGDTAIDQVVRCATPLRLGRYSGNEIRIEHAQLISVAAAKQCRDLGIILSMQPNFSTDSVDYADRLPQSYLSGNNPFRMLIDDVGFVPGRDLIFGSDGMPHGGAAALQRSLAPPLPGQLLTIDEFSAGYCASDNTLGTIKITANLDQFEIEICCK